MSIPLNITNNNLKNTIMNGSVLTEVLLFGAFFVWQPCVAINKKEFALFLVAKSNDFID